MPDDPQLDLFAAAPDADRPKPPRHFLPWDRPLLEQAAGWLLDLAGDARPIDLSHLLVIVPTKNAGRRLREMLANLADERGTAVIPPLAAPPSILTRPETGAARLGLPIAGEIESMAAWIAVLESADLGAYRALFPIDPPAQDFAWARSTARDLTALRRTLGESGLGLADVSRRLPDGHEEMERWRDLARLEAAWLAWLDRQLGCCDREQARAMAAREAGAPEGVREVILLGTPDPYPLAIDALESLATAGVPVTVAVYSPESLAGAFDEWGRPAPDHWLATPIEIPDFSHTARIVSNPNDLIRQVTALACALPDPAETLALGAVDAELAPLLEAALRERGVPAFNPEGRRVSQEGFHHLLGLLTGLLSRPRFEALRELLRVPEMDAWLHTRIDRWDARHALWALDESHRLHLASRLAKVRAFLLADAAESQPSADWKAGRYELAAAAVREVESLLGGISRGPLETTLAAALGEIVGARVRHGADGAWAEKVIEAAAPVLMQGLAQLAHVGRAGLDLEPSDQMALLGDLVGEVPLGEDRPALAIEMQGWLELLWEDAPHLIVAGLNDGIVPEAIVGDAYLPENLRSLRVLRLKTNDDRLVRDLYLLRALIEPRRDTGRLDLLVPKTSADGDPLRPSRLLFRCRDSELPARVAHLFSEAEAPGTQASWSPGFTLMPGLDRSGAPEKPVERVAVTAFANYLASPFHFWAQNVMRLTEIDPDKAEMDDLDFGNFCHEVLECFGKDPEARTWTDAERIESYLLSEADRVSARLYGPHPGLAVRIQIDSAKQRLAAAARHEAAGRLEGWEIIGVEVKLADHYPLRLGGIEVSGKIDRVERRGDCIRVLDYKTSDSKKDSLRDHVVENRLGDEPDWPPAYALFDHLDFRPRSQGKPPGLKTYRFKKLQLPLYALAIAQTLPEAEISCGYFHLTKATGDLGPEAWTVDADLLAAARRCAEGVIADVLAGRFDRIEVSAREDALTPLHLGAPDRTLDLTHVGAGDGRPHRS
jgi:ATP-dependent helicase/nuclease subunit B